MARIRHTRTLVERTVPDRAVPYFPDYEVIEPDPPAEEKKPARRKAESATTTEE